MNMCKLSRTGLSLGMILLFTISLMPGHAFAGGSALIQGDFNVGANGGNFEVVAQEGDRLCHYWRNNDAPPTQWHLTECFADNVKSAPALIQSDFDPGLYGGNFEVVVQQGDQLCHWWRNNETPPFEWRQTECFADNVKSAPTLIQSVFIGTSVSELINDELEAAGCNDEDRYKHCSQLPSNTDEESSAKTGCYEQVDHGCVQIRINLLTKYGLETSHPNFEVVVQQGNQVCHWWRNNAVQPYQWRQTECFVTDR